MHESGKRGPRGKPDGKLSVFPCKHRSDQWNRDRTSCVLLEILYKLHKDIQKKDEVCYRSYDRYVSVLSCSCDRLLFFKTNFRNVLENL